MNLRWLPNAITITRMVMAPPLAWLLLSGHYAASLWLALLAGLSDVLDGYLAKRYDWRSTLGGLLDPIADKLLLAACFFGLWWDRQVPAWLLALVFGRDLVIVAGAWVYWRWVGPFQPAPSFVSKINTLMQIVLVTGLLVHLGLQPLPVDMLAGLMLATALLTTVSGLDYVFRYGWRTWRALGSRK